MKHQLNTSLEYSWKGNKTLKVTHCTHFNVPWYQIAMAKFFDLISIFEFFWLLRFALVHFHRSTKRKQNNSERKNTSSSHNKQKPRQNELYQIFQQNINYNDWSFFPVSFSLFFGCQISAPLWLFEINALCQTA